MSERSLMVGAAAAALLAVARPASALQPLDQFVTSAKDANLDNREARATAEQRAGDARQAWARIGPSFVARGTYTRNQFEAVVSIPDCPTTGPCPTPPPMRSATFVPYNQLDATLTLNLPLIDVGAWQRVGSTGATADAARARAQATGLDVEKAVVRSYFQVVASEATLAAAERALATADESKTIVGTRRAAGAAADLDVERARAEVERARQVVASAEQARAVARRALESLTGLAPSAGTVPLPDDGLADEPALDQLEPGVAKLPAVRAASLETRAASKSADAAWAALAPTASANATERFTNAAGFGSTAAWSVAVTATWSLDPANYFAAKSQSAARAVAEVREKRAAQNARDDLHTAWQEVRADLARVRAARAESDASARAAKLARERYLAGTATQLDVQQADRDAFNSEVARIQALADLAYARAAVRVDSGRPR